MRKVWLVAGQELWINIRRPGFVIMTLLIPALGLVGLLVAFFFGGQQVGDFFESQFTPHQEKIGYVDHSGLLAVELPQYADTFIAYPDEEAARAALVAKEVGSYFVLPSDYLATGHVTVYSHSGGFATAMAVDEGDIRPFLIDHLLHGQVDDALRQRVLEPLDAEIVTLDEKGQVSTESAFSWVSDFVIPYLFSILFVITLFTASGFLLQGVSEEKEGRIIEILLSSLSPTQLLAGKILGLGALGLIQVSVWVGAGAALIGAATTVLALAGVVGLNLSTVLLGIVYFVLGYLLFATLMAVAGAMGTTQRESQQIAGIFSLTAAVPWMTMGFLFANPNAPFAVALSYFPLTAPVMMLLRLGFGQVPMGQIVISLALLVIGIAVSLWAGAKIFRASLLMYGKRPGIKDLVRAFREA